jgi:hypothetical protein
VIGLPESLKTMAQAIDAHQHAGLPACNDATELVRYDEFIRPLSETEQQMILGEGATKVYLLDCTANRKL